METIATSLKLSHPYDVEIEVEKIIGLVTTDTEELQQIVDDINQSIAENRLECEELHKLKNSIGGQANGMELIKLALALSIAWKKLGEQRAILH